MPLSGFRILDLTRIISGPFCTSLLADMGAEVIKIETPGEGDPVRAQGVIRDGLSWYFANYNRNKKSVTLDLYSEEGKAVLRRLIAECDVIVENYRPGVMQKMGLGDEALKALKPDIIHCSINGFGTTGPYRDRPAFDFIAQAMSGFMSLNGAESQPPMRAGPPISDLVAGMNGALGIVAALLRRERTGQGDSVSVSLLGSMIGLLSFQASNYFADGRLPARTGNDHGIASPYGLFETADGQVAIAPSNDVVYHKLLDALELSELRADPRFATNADRMRNRGAITEAIQTRTRQHTSAHWIERLNRFGVPCGQVLNLQEVFEDPQVQDQRMAIDVPHGGHGDVRMLGFPIKFAQAEARPVQPAPALGADTRDVLLQFGFAQDDILGLQERGVI
ncbi:CoA transferase [Achromobacter mucicolens]|uniref:Acetyl-CoA:oxalate CoA-transferase n=1 Tax=Achromobacter mucicolens TaxID=1389922 RepID=A0ABD4Z0Y5_9BURK|nr:MULTISPECIES: CoA transferase [Achromobacter]MCU6619830.1 CoA transferase [Achromobacter mucicolens]MDH1180759.1 CoA transferase [Achromobacter mucicolens]UDG76347.1 CoA transferase [Achromobacter sp. 77]CAB3906204.1 Acetyl-CoA:oxalate CoA-transferase [Achromobacter mucicolens]